MFSTSIRIMFLLLEILSSDAWHHHIAPCHTPDLHHAARNRLAFIRQCFNWIQLDFNPNSMELNFKSQSAQHSRQSHLKAPSVYCVDLLIGRNLSYAQVKMLPVQSLFNPLNSDASPKTDQHLSRAQTRLSDRSKFESLSQPGFRL